MGLTFENYFMGCFFYNGHYCSDLDDLIEQVLNVGEDVCDLPDGWSITCTKSKTEPIVVLSADWLVDRIDDERFSEENESEEFNKIIEILNKHIDFNKINSEIPVLNYESTHDTFIVTKQELLDYVG